MHIPTERVLVKPIQEPEKVGLIHVPEQAKDRPEKGEVILTCEDARCRAGDVIYYGQFTGHNIKLDGEELRLIKCEDILLVID
jgi:chaperonin GroES